MSQKNASEKSPNDTLAEEVAGKLFEAGLISKAKLAEVVAKVKAGTASVEDWKLWVDVSQNKNPGGKNVSG